MNSLAIKKFIFTLLLGLITSSNADVVFFDLNGTLLQNSRKMGLLLDAKSLAIDGISFKFRHFLSNFRKHITDDIFFKGLNAIEYKLPTSCQVDYEMYSDDGITPLPPLLRDTMLGYFTHKTAKKLCDQMLADNPHLFKKIKIPLSDRFIEYEKNLFLNIFEITFNPQVFASTQQTTHLVETLKKCAAEVDAKGKKKHVCIILSNWAKDGIPEFKKRFKDNIMPYIDECIFSCDGFGGKPAMSIYKHCYDLVKTKYPDQLRKSWFFLDDQKINCDGFETFLANASFKIKPKLFCAHPVQGESMLKKHGVISA